MDLSVTNAIGDWVRLTFPEFAFIINSILAIIGILGTAFGMAPMLIWMERKVSAHMQGRLGPMRVGPHGLLQSAADIIKLLFKEILIPKGADKFLFFLAPALPLTASFLILSIIPFDHHLQVTDPEQGVIYVIAISGLGILGILLGGWSSNSKYSLLGAMRAGAQMLSYEVSIALGMLFIVLITGTASLREIVLSQQGNLLDWWVFKAPGIGLIAFALFLISSVAELNRAPFDIAEAEQEITGGFHTEYSGMAFALFFLAEYINMIIAAALGAVFFLGGFLPPLTSISAIDNILLVIPGFIWMLIKVVAIIFFYMWLRWTLPRPRVDQLIILEWKYLLPMNLVLLFLGGIFLSLGWIL